MTNFLCSSGFLSGILYVFVAILILLLMITIHELGHYTAGKLLHFKINEFSIGFGKAFYEKTMKSGEKFAIRIFPLGGYCAFEGEDANSDVIGSFNSQKCWKRLIVLFFGAFFNFLSAILFSIILLMAVGDNTPKIVEIDQNVMGNPNPNAVVLEVDDVILEINGKRPTFLNGGITQLLNKYNIGDKIELTIKRNDKKLDEPVIIEKVAYYYQDDFGRTIETGVVGIKSDLVTYSFGEALVKCVPFCCETAWECLVILGKLLIGQYSVSDIGGPITTVKVIAKASAMSFKNILLLIPVIAVNLAVFNLLPLPALDGGRMVFVLIEWIRKKPVNRDLENKIHTIGIIVLFTLVIIIDLLQLFVFRSI